MTSFSPYSQSAYEKLLSAAHILFYDHGINGTGIDAILKRAGVAKKSLYNNFASKDELVATYLRVRHEEWLSLYKNRLEVAMTPRKRVMAVFSAYKDHAEYAYENGFRGCGLLNAAAELPAGAPCRQAVLEHKQEVEAILAAHLTDLMNGKAESARSMARHFAFLLEGSISRAGLEGNSDCVTHACNIAEQMMEAY
ncbi:TetR/AcrR family transcriptional regulator [Pantoea ananatis]|uniref:TetR/AcrR family transcriptional regulator n=1 Tax=Pantoea ananas TaxID=553 RepID=UPI000CF4E5AE|nr:TetR/AcrR family transcriptional regulator [Pantoea ananatis]PQK94932.1 TetR family transcriptional regulator [Pantoea ananatis]PXV97489.1 TetR family transcriptional regulator [Pantoea ananatis]